MTLGRLHPGEFDMTFNALIKILRSRLWFILLLPLGAAGAALLFSKLETATYAANATIVLDYRKPLEGELAGELLPVGLQPSYIATQVDIIKSRPVAAQVIAMLHLSDSPKWKERFAAAGVEGASFNDWLLGTLMDSLEVTVGTENRLIYIWYKDADPEVAASLANAFVDSYRQITRQLDQNPALETAQSVEATLAKLRENLEEAEKKVSTYQSRMGIMATDERLDVETANLTELSRQRLLADANDRAAESRLDAAQDLASRPGTNGAAAGGIGNDLIQSLQIALARKESEIADRATSLGERHPEMRQLRAEQLNLRKQLEAETAKLVDGIRADWVQAHALAESARQAETDQKAKLMELKQVRNGLQPLLRELESAQTSYDRALDMYSEYAMHSNLNQTSVSLLSAAQVPSTPASPNVLLNVASALFGCLIFAIGAVLLWEFVDKRVRTKEEVADLGIAGYLGVLPKA
jgi:polysaccharide biosynthesis transport protein